MTLVMINQLLELLTIQFNMMGLSTWI